MYIYLWIHTYVYMHISHVCIYMNVGPQLLEIWAFSICSKWLCPVIYERKLKFLGTRKGDEAGLGKDTWYRKKWFSKAGIHPETLPSPGSLGAWETETPLWGELQSDSHSQQTFPRCTAENCKENTKTLLFKAEFQEPKSHSLLYKCPPMCRHTIKNRLVEIHSSWFYSYDVNISLAS